jgi:hypothetical protein
MLRNLTVVIDADIARFQAAIANVSGGLQGFAQQAQKVGTTLSAAISLPLALIGKQAISTFSDMDALRRGLATLEKDSGSLTARLSELREVAKLPGLGVKEAIQFDVSLRSAGLSADLSKKAMMSFGNALATVGKGKNELKGVSAQLQQLATKTGGYGADLRIIKEYAPQTGAALMKAFGTIDTEAIAKAGYTGKQVIEKLSEELGKLPKATGGAKNGFENFSDSAGRALDKLGAGLYKGLHVGEFLDSVGSAIGKLADKFGNLPATTQSLAGAFGLVVVALPPIIAGIGFFTTTVLPALRAGMVATRAAATLMLGPIGLIAAAVAAAAVLIIMHWDRIKAALVNTGVWTQLKDIVKSAFGFITSIFGVFANLFQGDWHNMFEHLKNIAKYAWNGIVSVVGTSILAMGGLIGKALSLFGLKDWSKSVGDEMKEVEKRLATHKWKIDAPKFDILEGMQYGGKDVADGSNATNKGGKKAKTKAEVENYDLRTTLEKDQAALAELQREIDNFNYLGVNPPQETLNRFSQLTTEIGQLDAKLKALKASSTTIKNTGKDPIQDNIASEPARRTRITDLQLMGPVSVPKLPNLAKFQKEVEDAFKPMKKSMEDLNNDIRNALSQAAQSAFEGMGEIIGGLMAGTAGLEDLPRMLLGVLGGLLQQLGKMAITVGIGVAAIKKALQTLNPVVAIAAGVALIALGAYAKSGTKKIAGYEKGGLFTGESTIRVAESHKARQGGGEWVTPVQTGAYLMTKEMAKMGAFNQALNAGVSDMQSRSQSSKMASFEVKVGGEFKVSAEDIKLVLARNARMERRD